ncbi:alpha/beta hydrolase [Microbacterium sp. STN6]|uniref:alpha/beta fold hydrolase n=1 Tax=Microbacterium sp. STN6 TaxID=2995588 RepID=UPI0022609BF2|nr:alpha/beta hydrolase [Microbacterium sp. STN6]MCX7523085.1 alpha/beta hydrolase [Microbacterium sp. STN6]
MSNVQFTLTSGRRLGLTASGDPTATRVVVFCHPAPGSAHFDPDPPASRSDVHVIGIDRPGYGSSDPLPEGEWPSVAQAADDIADYLRSSEHTATSLGAHEFDSVAAVGWSAGGRVALALAARHPDLVDKVAVVATPAPNEEVEWIPPEFVAMSEKLAAMPAGQALSKLGADITHQMGDQLPGEDPEQPVPLGQLGVTDADAAALARPGVEQRLDGMLRDAFRQGAVGLATDILSYTARPWGFDLSDVQAETLLVYGEADAVAPPEHGGWYRDHLASAHMETVPEVGHLVIIPAWKRILDFLAEPAQR